VTNLPDGTTEHSLRRLFSPFGAVYRVSLSPPAEADHPVGIVQLDQVEDAEVAIGWLDGDVYGGLALGVEWAEPFVPPPDLRDLPATGGRVRDLRPRGQPLGGHQRVRVRVRWEPDRFGRFPVEPARYMNRFGSHPKTVSVI
jgi:hypothetical protein